MALQSFATDVSMSLKDINTELGVSTTSLIDFLGAAASFSGIRNVETTEGFGALAVEMKEFYGKTFAAGSGTYGTRNAHVLRFLSDDGSLRAYGGSELVFAAEAVVSPTSINGTVSTFNLTRFVDDFVDDDLTSGDDIYNSETGTAVFDNSSHIVNSIAGDSSKYYCDDTADKVFRLSDTGNVTSIIFPRKPEKPTVSLSSKTDSQIVVNITGDTRVARTMRVFSGGSSVATQTGTGAGGSDFTSGRVNNTGITTQHTFSSLSANQTIVVTARYENAFDNGDTSDAVSITTNAGATAWSNQFGNFSMNIDNDDSDSQTATSSEVTIDLAFADGDTTISCEQPSNGTAALKVKVGTSSGNYDLQGTFATSATVAAASKYFLLFELTEGTADGEFAAEDRTITFTNNSVSPSTAPEINVQVGPGR